MTCTSIALFLGLAALALGQTPPSITNVTNAATPAIDYPALAPGSVAIIQGANLADSTASSAPPWQPVLSGVEVHLVQDPCSDTSCDLVANLVHVSPAQIDFVVPNVPNARTGTIRVVIVKNGRRYPNLASVLINAIYLESSPNPAIYDTPVTFMAHVAPMQGVPGSLFNPDIGAVTFMDGVTPLGVVKLSNVITYADTPPLRRYDVSFTTSKLEAGDHSIWVAYTGDNNNNPGTSGVITQSIRTPEMTILLSPNPSTFGTTVTMVATVSPSTCTGSISFFDEWEQLGTAAVSGGRAVMFTASLPIGNHPITVKYSGDASCPSTAFGPANNFDYRGTSQTVNPVIPLP